MHRISDQPQSDLKSTLRAYLLSELGPEEQEQIEQQFLVDQDFFQEASIVEDEIIDEYLSDTLSERDAFNRSFLSTPHRRQKVRLAMALRMYVSDVEDQASAKSAEEPGLRSWFRIFRTLRREHSHTIGTA